jgi:hypothetical protein
MAIARREFSETKERANGHSSKEKDRDSVRQVTAVFVRNCVSRYSLAVSAIAVSNQIGN